MFLTLGSYTFDADKQQDKFITYVDWVERNHFYNEHAELVFVQLIFYDYNPVTNKSEVVAWKMDNNKNIIPLFDHANKRIILRFVDGGTLRTIITYSFVESWTQYDEELFRRHDLDPRLRRGFDTKKYEYYRNRYSGIFNNKPKNTD